MNVEQRLLHAFELLDRVEPSSDLWSRVVHSIDEDRAHRRRVVWSSVATIAVLLGLVAVGAAFVRDGVFGPYVDRRVMEMLEVAGAAFVVAVMAPALRRFGRNYVHDLFPAADRVADGLLRLVDVAYYLVFAGYILMTTQFEFRLGVAGLPAARDLGQQLEEASTRFGGLLLVMGVLHATALVVLPVVALIHNSTRHGRPLPGWLRIGGTLLLVLGSLLALPMIVGIVVGSS